MIPLNFSETRTVRMLELDGCPVFVAEDIAKLLGVSNVNQMLDRFVFPEDRVRIEVQSIYDGQPVSLVTEAGVWAFLDAASENAPNRAESVRQWFRRSVMPDIHLVYGTPDENGC